MNTAAKYESFWVIISNSKDGWENVCIHYNSKAPLQAISLL